MKALQKTAFATSQNGLAEERNLKHRNLHHDPVCSAGPEVQRSPRT